LQNQEFFKEGDFSLVFKPT